MSAIGAGDGDHLQRGAGLAVEAMGDLGAARFQTRHSGDAGIGKAKGLDALGLDQAGAGPSAQSLRHKGTAIAGRARPGDETHGVSGAGCDLAAVHGQGCHALRAQPGQRLRGVLKMKKGLAHQKLSSSPGSVEMIWDCTSTSGSTPRRLSVCCTT